MQPRPMAVTVKGPRGRLCMASNGKGRSPKLTVGWVAAGTPARGLLQPRLLLRLPALPLHRLAQRPQFLRQTPPPQQALQERAIVLVQLPALPRRLPLAQTHPVRLPRKPLPAPQRTNGACNVDPRRVRIGADLRRC